MFIFEALVSVLFSFLVLRNLRLNVNSTSVVITSVLLFLLFAENRKFRLFDSRRDQILTLVFSMTLAAANNLGSHVHIDFDAPWGNAALNHITAYSIVDILSIVVLTLVIYCAVNVLIREIEALSARHSRQNVKKVIPFWIPMAVMFIFWMPYFILYYPGFVFGDSLSSIEQALGYWELSNHHPVMYTLFIKLCIMIGKVLAAVLRGLISSAIIIALSYAFGAHFTITPLFLLVLILNCAIFAEIGFAAAMFLSTYEQMGQVNTYILLPMSFLCGTFFSTKALPDALRIFIECLPLTHTSYLLRGIGSGAEVSLWSVGILLIYLVAVFVIGGQAFIKLKN